MNNLPLENIASNYNEIILFLRDKEGKQIIQRDASFLASYYEPDSTGNINAQNGTKLRQLFHDKWWDIKKIASAHSYSSDIPLIKQYLIQKIDTIELTNFRYQVIDIETISKEVPEPVKTKSAKDKISCIGLWDSYDKQLHQWFLPDYKDNEFLMLEDFIAYIKANPPDIMAGWNFTWFDYPFLYYKYPDFSKTISPVGLERWTEPVQYPAGISIIDLMALYKKLTLNKKDSYSLNSFLEDVLDLKRDFDDVDFINDLNTVKAKNASDVLDLVKGIQKLRLLESQNIIRCFSKCEWEDLVPDVYNEQFQSNNSKVWDYLVLNTAKELNRILPNKPRYAEGETTEIKKTKGLDGAYRGLKRTGRFFNIQKLDLSEAYPKMVTDFCLDIENISEVEIPNSIKIEVKNREDGNIKGTYWIKQNLNTVLPKAFKLPFDRKHELKAIKKSFIPDSEEAKQSEMEYDSFKGVVNSGWGYVALMYSRMFDYRLANMITFLVRDLVDYVQTKLEKLGYEIIYWDTDSVFVNANINVTDIANQLIQEWAMDKYGNDHLTLEFEDEGKFDKLFIVALCRYIGYLNTGHGVKKEIKGVQLKRKDYEQFVKDFQSEIIDLILNNQTKEEIIPWIENQIQLMKQRPLKEIAVPCKFNKTREDYGKKEIFFTALDETQKLCPTFTKKIGEKFWWLYTKNEYVLAFDLKNQQHIQLDNIDWNAIIEKNIFKVLMPIFKGMGWELDLLTLAEKYQILLGSTERKELLEDRPDYNQIKDNYTAKSIKLRMLPQKEIIKKSKKKVAKSV